MVTREPVRNSFEPHKALPGADQSDHTGSDDAVPVHLNGEDAADDERSSQSQSAPEKLEPGHLRQDKQSGDPGCQDEDTSQEDLGAHGGKGNSAGSGGKPRLSEADEFQTILCEISKAYS